MNVPTPASIKSKFPTSKVPTSSAKGKGSVTSKSSKPQKTERYSSNRPLQNHPELRALRDSLKPVGTTQLRHERTVRALTKAEERAKKVDRAITLKNEGTDNAVIAEKLGVAESTVRTWLKPTQDARVEGLVGLIVKLVGERGLLDVSYKTEQAFGVPRTAFWRAVTSLDHPEFGYKVYYLPSVGESLQFIVLTKSDVTFQEALSRISEVVTYGSEKETN